MNEQLEERIVESLTDILDFVDSAGSTAGEFVAGQAPLVVEEIIVWGIAKWSWLMLMAISAFFCSRQLFKAKKAMKIIRLESPSKYTGSTTSIGEDLSLIGAIALRFLSLTATCFWIALASKPIFAPRLYVMEVLREML